MTRALNVAISTMRNAGELEQIHAKYVEAQECSERGVLSVTTMQGIFIMLACTMVLGAVSLAVERCAWRHKSVK